MIKLTDKYQHTLEFYLGLIIPNQICNVNFIWIQHFRTLNSTRDLSISLFIACTSPHWALIFSPSMTISTRLTPQKPHSKLKTGIDLIEFHYGNYDYYSLTTLAVRSA